MNTLVSAMTALLIALPCAVQADSASPKIAGFYLGAGIGNPSGELESEELNSRDLELSENSQHLMAGYQFNRIIGIELQYVKYGEASHGLFDPASFSASANLGYSFDSGLRPFAILGFGATDLNIRESPYVEVISDTGTSFHYGLGVEFAPQPLAGVSLRLGYESEFLNMEIQDYWGNETYDVQLHSVYGALLYKF